MLPGRRAPSSPGTAGALVVYLGTAAAPRSGSYDRGNFPAAPPGSSTTKWRIDELYDATVVGMVDALADIFTMADKWIIRPASSPGSAPRW